MELKAGRFFWACVRFGEAEHDSPRHGCSEGHEATKHYQEG